MNHNRAGSTRVLPIVVIAVLGAVGWALSSGALTKQQEQALEGVAVAEGPLRISENVAGNLEAKDSISLNCEIEGNSTILHLIEEGTIVAEGDLIAELDVSEMTDRRVAQEITVQNAEAAETKASEQYDIQEIQNESDIASAELKVQFARIDKEKYIEGDWPLKKQAALESIQLRKEEFERAADNLEWTTKLEEKGFVQRTELEADRLAHERARIAHEQAIREQQLMIQYENPRRLAELDADIEELARDLEKTRKQAKARLADYLAAKESAVARLGLEREKLNKIITQIGKAEIRAPAPGMVVYGRSSSRYGSSEPVQLGSSVRERQEIVSLPKPGGMVVKASLHETVLEKVAVGQPCLITIDAMSKQVFRGRVEFVAPLPDSQRWFANPNQRLYKAEISLEEGTPDMRPGMSCNVEIFAAALEKVLYVPVQCVFMDGGQSIAFKRGQDGFEPTQVVTGLDNSKWVEIKSGLALGDIVALAPPSDFSPKATPQKPASDMPDLPFPVEGAPANPAARFGAGGMRPEGGGMPAAGGPDRSFGGGSGRPGEGAGGAPSGAPSGSESGRSGGSSARGERSGAGGRGGSEGRGGERSGGGGE